MRALDELRAFQIEGEPDVVQDIVKAYLQEAKVKIDELQRAFEDKDYDTLQRNAHSLKSSSGNLGLSRLASFTMELDALCKENQAADGAELVDMIIAEFINVEKELDKVISK